MGNTLVTMWLQWPMVIHLYQWVQGSMEYTLVTMIHDYTLIPMRAMINGYVLLPMSAMINGEYVSTNKHEDQWSLLKNQWVQWSKEYTLVTIINTLVPVWITQSMENE